jgi:hypothetical protein
MQQIFTTIVLEKKKLYLKMQKLSNDLQHQNYK